MNQMMSNLILVLVILLCGVQIYLNFFDKSLDQETKANIYSGIVFSLAIILIFQNFAQKKEKFEVDKTLNFTVTVSANGAGINQLTNNQAALVNFSSLLKSKLGTNINMNIFNPDTTIPAPFTGKVVIENNTSKLEQYFGNPSTNFWSDLDSIIQGL